MLNIHDRESYTREEEGNLTYVKMTEQNKCAMYVLHCILVHYRRVTHTRDTGTAYAYEYPSKFKINAYEISFQLLCYLCCRLNRGIVLKVFRTVSIKPSIFSTNSTRQMSEEDNRN